jgi:hypothetical membrane protein
MEKGFEDRNAAKFGFYSSIVLVVLTLITFGFALSAVPISGVLCPENCITYPYLDTLSQFPKDYVWMFFAFFQLLAYLIFAVSIDCYSSADRKVTSRVGLTLAILSIAILLVTYFLQFSVVPASLMYNETEGIALITQYNPHGIFIALEELGYLLTSLSFVFVAPLFDGENNIETTIRWVFIVAFILSFISFIGISLKYGIVRKDRFEIIVLSIDWLVLIINGLLIAVVFKNKMKTERLIQSSI